LTNPVVSNYFHGHSTNLTFSQTGAVAIISNGHDTSYLNANPDPRHLSYKILGLLSWGVLVFCFISLGVATRLLLEVARVVAIYMMVRLVIFTVFYLAGLVKIMETEKRASASLFRGLTRQEIALFYKVHHLVVIPNFDEPQDILSRTLQALAVQEGARQNITVVLGMEEREPNAGDKANT
jgi:hypothetical protein